VIWLLLTDRKIENYVNYLKEKIKPQAVKYILNYNFLFNLSWACSVSLVMVMMN
jgi:hypothetical protein